MKGKIRVESKVKIEWKNDQHDGLTGTLVGYDPRDGDALVRVIVFSGRFSGHNGDSCGYLLNENGVEFINKESGGNCRWFRLGVLKFIGGI